MKVFVVEDDSKTLILLTSGLKEAGYNVEGASNGKAALAKILTYPYDFIILDVMLPEMDGLEILKKAREANVQTPAIFLSAKHTLSEKLEGLTAGCDDYVTKPFSLQEVLMRMEVIFRRSRVSSEKLLSLSYRDLEMNLVERQVTRNGIKIKLQGREFLLMEYFLKNPETILTKEMILKNVLEYQFSPQTNVVDVFVHRLRTKIDRDFEVKLIQNIRGVGYALKAE